MQTQIHLPTMWPAQTRKSPSLQAIYLWLTYICIFHYNAASTIKHQDMIRLQNWISLLCKFENTGKRFIS